MSKQAVQQAILRDIQNSHGFVLSAVKADWNAEIVSHIAAAFWLHVPAEVRIDRIVQRESKRFGSRVFEGGDLFTKQEDFRKMAAERTETIVEKSLQKLHCPVIQLDGTIPPEENAEKILKWIRNII